jgi:archaellum component FlaC
VNIWKGYKIMTEKELLEKIELLEKRVAELEKEVGYIKEDIYEFVEDGEECDGHCDCGHCGGCEEE